MPYTEQTHTKAGNAPHLLLIIILSLSSCVSERSKAASPTVRPPATVTVRFGDVVLMEQNSPNRRVLEKQVELFETSHPGIRIVLEAW